MATRSQRDREKKSQEKFQGVLARLLREEDNKYCADCDAKGPRWTSWNIGIFVCIRCAGIHRNLGVHISRVKSVNLDSWTEEQVDSMDNMGNRKARAIYEAHLPPDFRRPQTDSSLEHFIRCKYEKKVYLDKTYVPSAPKKKSIKDEEAEKDKKKRERRARTSSITLPKPEEAVARPQAAQPVLQPAQQNLVAAQLAASPPKTSSIPNSPLSTSPPTQQPAKQSAATDLLGLDNPGPSTSNTDLFGLSVNNTPSTQNKDLMQQKENQNPLDEPLFGSSAATTEEGVPENKANTKDSIMALYGSSNNQTVYNVPGGVYMPQTQNQFNMPQMMANGPTSGMMANGPSTQMMANGPSTGMMANGPSTGMMTNGPPTSSAGMMYGQQGMSGFNTMMAQPQQQLMFNAHQQQQQYLQQQYQMQQQVQQVQQQMQALRVGTHPANTQMGWQQASPGIQQGIPATAGAGGWGNMTTGHTHSTQLWK